jgi:hypothetical protein
MLQFIHHHGQPGSPLEPIAPITTPFNQWAKCHKSEPMDCITRLPAWDKTAAHPIYQALIPVPTKTDYTAFIQSVNNLLGPNESLKKVCLYQYANPSTAPFLGIRDVDDPAISLDPAKFTTFIVAVSTDPFWSIESRHLQSLSAIYTWLSSSTRGVSILATATKSQQHCFNASWAHSLIPLHSLASRLKAEHTP